MSLSAAKAGAAKPKAAVVASASASFFIAVLLSWNVANHRSLVQTQFRERAIVPKLLIFQVKMNRH
jgi:hypothetical protein